MLDSKTGFALSPRSAMVTVGLIVLLIALIDFSLPADYNIAIAYGIPVGISAWSRRSRFIWISAAAMVALTYLALIIGPDPSDHVIPAHVWFNRSLAALATIVTASLVNFWVRAQAARESAQEQVERRSRELEESNRLLTAREQEVARQNEELQSQTEELERQSEELRVSNEDLAQREKMLEALLDLSRSLTVEMPEQEVLTHICETLGALISGSTASAVLVRENEHFSIKCHHGFGPEGLESDIIPIQHSFSQIVMGHMRTAYIEDLSLRPDLKVPQAKTGKKIVSILSAPLLVRRRPVGTMEIYSRERRGWSEQQISLLESMAAQASISLENAELFDEVDRERRRLRAVLETVPFGIAICDADCRQIRFNPAGAAMLNVPPDAILRPGGDGRWQIYSDSELLRPEQSPMVRAARLGEIIHAEELELLFPSGRRLQVLISAAPIRDKDGKVLGAVAGWLDIGVQKELQRELDKRRREAEEASVRKTRFLAAASHDIRTPANAISLLAELIKRTADNPAMLHEIPQLSQELQASAGSLVNLVSDVLDITRFETGRLELHETDFALNDLIEEEVRQILPLAQNKSLHVEIDLGHEKLWLHADRIKLGRVMGNLLGNAIKFTDMGGVKVLAQRNQQDGLEVHVRDTGIGIHAQHQEHIFDEFFQLGAPDRSRGSGLGLAICKRLVEAMGGSIAVQSEPGVGSTFIVTLPAQALIPRPETSSVK